MECQDSCTPCTDTDEWSCCPEKDHNHSDPVNGDEDNKQMDTVSEEFHGGSLQLEEGCSSDWSFLGESDVLLHEACDKKPLDESTSIFQGEFDPKADAYDSGMHFLNTDEVYWTLSKRTEEEEFQDALEELPRKASCDDIEIYNKDLAYPRNLTIEAASVLSSPVSKTIFTEIFAPKKLNICDVDENSVSLSWERPLGLEGVAHKFSVSWRVAGGPQETLTTAENHAVVSGLRPGSEYTVSVCTILDNIGLCTVLCTKPSPPPTITAEEVGSTSVSLRWGRPENMDGVSYIYHITYGPKGEELRTLIKESDTSSAILSDLRPGVIYTFNISTVLDTGNRSCETSASVQTKTILQELVYELGLEPFQRKKLTISTVLEISKATVTEEAITSKKSLAWSFLKKLVMVNVTARSTMGSTMKNTALQNLENFVDSLRSIQNANNKLNPLDVITALFLCSDGLLQQELALKMSMCQFSVPLLLPNFDTQQCTLMLWALRDIVKKFRPHSIKDPRGYVEENIVLSKLPMISFVRLGTSTLSKSHILNQVLSNSQQYHDTFVHHNMAGGHANRLVSDGLVEISWYLPCGNANIDIFTEPVAVANLRGDICSFTTQFSFLCQTSAAVFVFCDNFGDGVELLSPDSRQMRGQLFLISNIQHSSFDVEMFKMHISKLNLKPKNIIVKSQQMNDAEFVDNLRMAVRDLLQKDPYKTSIEGMSRLAPELRVPVDEDYDKCQSARLMADAIITKISDIFDFKKKHLPHQGNICRELAKIEKEECRLKKAGSENVESYKSDLSEQKKKLREKQRCYDISDAMTCFMSAMSQSIEERSYFLKWMRIKLDNKSRKNLSCLRDEYKEKCLNFPENKQLIAELDHQICNSSLGVEHFMREMGQLYESACSLPKDSPSRLQMAHLPQLCAKLLLSGFPLELVDGDASNIPLSWIEAVMKELHQLTEPNGKIRIVTVLGVQSSGKSTLLNTMFGVQFAVSSGRCTRGAFMQLIRVQEAFRQEIGCDYLMIIDTEGLKSPELSQLDESYEHDNELATLVVGLSDITVINIAMENITEMKDILQIVVHAFLRMKEVGKKPCCHFVHQNVPDVSAHEKNLRDRKLLLEQLDEMTQIAAKMEKKEQQKFSDIMECNPEKNNWYIPGLWHGNPPMAPVNSGYSETVNEFRKSLILAFKECKRPSSTFSEFLEWTKSLWSAVKYENFIFSFRNSLVADAYSRLCVEFNKWEWDFKKHMYSWLTEAETVVSNFGISSSYSYDTIEDLLDTLKGEATVELEKHGNILLDKIRKYYEVQEKHVYLIEKYKEDFITTAKTVRRETENSVKNSIEAAVEIKSGMLRLHSITENHTETIEKRVLELVEKCRKDEAKKSEEELSQEFEQMWSEAVRKLSFAGLKKRDIAKDVHMQLRSNLAREGGSVNEMVSKVCIMTDAGMQPFTVDYKYGYFSKFWDKMFRKDQIKKTRNMADQIINECKETVAEKVQKNTDYHNTYTSDLLQLIDVNLQNHKDLQTSAEFAASLKIHICGHIAREFQKMHNDFIKQNDPRQCLEQYKHQYYIDFKDLFYEKDQCQRKAQEFADLCLAPAVRDYVTKSLSPDIVDEMLSGEKGKEFSTRSFFQFSVLKELLSEHNSKEYVRYNKNYERFVEDWILNRMVTHFSKNNTLLSLVEHKQKEMCKKIKEAVRHVLATPTESGENDGKGRNICQFIKDTCKMLSRELVFLKDAHDKVMVLNTATPEEFSQWLMCIVDDMQRGLQTEFEMQTDVKAVLSGLPLKPQKVLFKRVFGCGRQCPFCATPCEAGGENHTEHFASVHRPQGLGTYRSVLSKELVSDICSSSVTSEKHFRCSETNGELHPYKDYRKIFPDWLIQPDASIEASDYWKYVFVTFNEQFAKEYNAKPAVIPGAWKSIKKEDALESLKKTFGMQNS